MQYIKHINHVKNLLGGIDNIAVSTDDMTFENNPADIAPVFQHERVANDIRQLLKNDGYSEEDVEKILHKNFEEKY